MSRVSWAHPEFGYVIASGSFDRSVKVWEETTPDIDQPQLNGNAPSSASDSRWVERAVNTDAKGSVRGVEFAPHHFSLKLVRRTAYRSCLQASLTLSVAPPLVHDIF